MRAQRGQLLGCGQAYLVAHAVVAGDGMKGGGGGAPGDRGQQLGCGQAYLVGHSVVAGDGQTALGGGTRVQSGQVFGCGQAHLVGNAVVAGDGRQPRAAACGSCAVGCSAVAMGSSSE